MIVGLSGYAQSGKDTVGKILVDNHGFERKAFADILRQAAYILNPWIGGERLQAVVDRHGWERAKALQEVRRLLQVFGTEVGRELLGQDVWVNALHKQLEPTKNYVITDVRFPNEARFVWFQGGKLWRVIRPGFRPVNPHASETALDATALDATILNNGTLELLAGRVETALFFSQVVPVG